MLIEVNEKVRVVPANEADMPAGVNGPKAPPWKALTVPTVGVPPVPLGTDIVTDESLPLVPVSVAVRVKVYVELAPATVELDDQDRLPRTPNALAGRAATRVLDTAENSAIITMSVVRPRPTRRRPGRHRGRVAHARTVL
jgi:hypothetical protein